MIRVISEDDFFAGTTVEEYDRREAERAKLANGGRFVTISRAIMLAALPSIVKTAKARAKMEASNQGTMFDDFE